MIGEELVTNGGFDADSDWTKGTGVTISGGVVNATSATAIITQTISLVSGNVYAVTFDYTMASGLALRIEGSGILATSPALGSSGNITLYITANSTTFSIAASGDLFTGSIDNISVREIDPLAVSIAMEGKVTYADDVTDGQLVRPYRWHIDNNNRIVSRLSVVSGSDTGNFIFQQTASSVNDEVASGSNTYSPGVLVPFNIASRHGSTFINGAVDGTALTADTTPTALPDLSATDLSLGDDLMGTIKTFRVWDKDIGDTGIAGAST